MSKENYPNKCLKVEKKINMIGQENFSNPSW